MRSDWRPDPYAMRERPLGELLGDLVREAQELVREEVRVAKAEVRDEARKAAKGGAGVGAGGAILYAALLLLGVTLILIGATFLPAWASALLVTALYAVAGLTAVNWGRAELRKADPSRAVANLREDGRWARETMHDIRSSRSAHA